MLNARARLLVHADDSSYDDHSKNALWSDASADEARHPAPQYRESYCRAPAPERLNETKREHFTRGVEDSRRLQSVTRFAFSA